MSTVNAALSPPPSGAGTATQNTPPLTDKERWQSLMMKYGKLGAIRPYWLGEPPPRIAEREPKLAWYIQGLIYATSLATLFVFGEAEIFLITKFGAASAVSVILGFLLGLLGMMVYAMDRSSARTIPRIGILAQRRQWGLWLEHVLYSIGVGSVQAFTYGLIIYTMENNADAIVTGKSLIPPGAVWIFGLIIVRSILLVWTIWHSYLTSEELEVQWGTFGRQGVSLVGGSALSDLTHLDVSQMDLGKKLRVFDKLTTPPQRAPGGWKFWKVGEWRAAQATFDATHRAAVIATIEEMTTTVNPPLAVAPVDLVKQVEEAVARYAQQYADQVEQSDANIRATLNDYQTEWEQRLAAWVRDTADEQLNALTDLIDQKLAALMAVPQPAASFSTSGAASSSGAGAHMAPSEGGDDPHPPPAKRKSLVAGTNRAFVAALRDANNRLIQKKEDTSLFNLARELNVEGIGPAEIKAVLEQLNEQRINGLKPNRQLPYDALLDGVSLI